MFDYDPYARLDPVATFTVRSADIIDEEPLPIEQLGAGLSGRDRSPQLSWSGAPTGTRSYAVTVFDPDAPTASGFWHWAVYNIPAAVTQLAAGAGTAGSALLPEGAITLPNELRLPEFTGAAPPRGSGTHRYYFVVHAVDVPRLDLPDGCTPAILGSALHRHTLGRAILMATAEAS